MKVRNYNFEGLQLHIRHFLTLIVLGVVKVDLADFDINLRENILCTFKKLLVLAKCPANFLLFIHKIQKLHSVFVLTI
jgi:hypothetical protein